MGTKNYNESKKLAIKYLEEDLSNSTLYADAFAIRPESLQAFYEAYLNGLREDNPLKGDGEVEDKQKKKVCGTIEAAAGDATAVDHGAAAKENTKS